LNLNISNIKNYKLAMKKLIIELINELIIELINELIIELMN